MSVYPRLSFVPPLQPSAAKRRKELSHGMLEHDWALDDDSPSCTAYQHKQYRPGATLCELFFLTVHAK